MLDRLASELRQPKLIAGYVDAYVAERRSRAANARRDKGKLETQLTASERAISALVDALADGTLTKEEVGERLEKARAEKARVSAFLDAADDRASVVELHPRALARFRETVDRLAPMLAGTDQDLASGELAVAFRELVHGVVVAAREPFAPYEIEVKGRLSAILGEEVWPRPKVGSSSGAG